MSRDIAINWFNWPIILLTKICEKEKRYIFLYFYNNFYMPVYCSTTFVNQYIAVYIYFNWLIIQYLMKLCQKSESK